MSDDFYDVLGVSKDATEEEIQQAFRTKAAEYHPDVSDEPDAEKKFKKIKKAKEVLTDDEKRQAYDQMGHDRFEQAEKRGGFDGGAGGGAGGPFGGAGGGAGGPFGGAGGGGFEDIFSQFFGGGGGSSNRPRQGRDLRTRLEIDLKDAYEGLEKQLKITRPERCPDCGGSGHPADADAQTCPECNGQGQVTQVRQTALGRVQQASTCPRCEGEGTIYSDDCDACNGAGVVQNNASLTVEIPAGIQDGQTLRMEREGAPGENNGPNGDLLIEVAVADHSEFERDGDDLRYSLPISFPKAVFGATVEVPTLEGPAELDIPAGTQSGESFRIRDKGMPRLRRRGQGDLHVRVQVVTPEKLNEEQREALEAFAEAGGEDIEVESGFFDKIRNSL
jgi:molecular chaperone DnaJ